MCQKDSHSLWFVSLSKHRSTQKHEVLMLWKQVSKRFRVQWKHGKNGRAKGLKSDTKSDQVKVGLWYAKRNYEPSLIQRQVWCSTKEVVAEKQTRKTKLNLKRRWEACLSARGMEPCTTWFWWCVSWDGPFPWKLSKNQAIKWHYMIHIVQRFW